MAAAAVPIIGSVAGALISKKGSKGSSSQTTTNEPWGPLQQPLQNLYGSAEEWFKNDTPQYFPGDTVAGSNAALDAALDRGQGRAAAGSPLNAVARGQNEFTQHGGYLNSNPNTGYLSDTMGGKFLNANPYLDEMYKSATDPLVEQFKNATAPGIGSQFSIAGRMGSGAHQGAMEGAQNALGRGLASASSNIYGNAYAQERQLQQQAAGTLGQNFNIERGLQTQAQRDAPMFANTDFADLERLMGIGQFRQGQEQNRLNAGIERHNFDQNKQLTKLQNLAQILQGGSAYATQNSNGMTQQPTNPFNGMLGGASFAQGLMNQFGGGGSSGFGGAPSTDNFAQLVANGFFK